jgi:hypothetical protein
VSGSPVNAAINVHGGEGDRRTIMSFDKNDVKHGIDNMATHLKGAVDKIADATDESREKVSDKAREIARKAGEEMIEQGHKLKNASSGLPNDASAGKTRS